MVAIAYTMLVLVRPWGGLMRLFGLYPAVRAAMTGIGVAAVLAGLVDGVGFTTAGAAAAVVLPLVTLAALRVLDHADDRTLAEFLATDPDATTSSSRRELAVAVAGRKPKARSHRRSTDAARRRPARGRRRYQPPDGRDILVRPDDGACRHTDADDASRRSSRRRPEPPSA